MGHHNAFPANSKRRTLGELYNCVNWVIDALSVDDTSPVMVDIGDRICHIAGLTVTLNDANDEAILIVRVAEGDDD